MDSWYDYPPRTPTASHHLFQSPVFTQSFPLSSTVPRLSLQSPIIPCRHLPSLAFLHRDCGCQPSPVIPRSPLPSPAVPCRLPQSPVVPSRPLQSPVVPCRPPPLTTIPTTNSQSSRTPCLLVSQIAVPSSLLKTAVFRFCGRGRHIFSRPVRSRALGSPSSGPCRAPGPLGTLLQVENCGENIPFRSFGLMPTCV